LLDLFVAGEEGQRISISSCCIAAAVPPTTALRWIGMLKKRGLIQEVVDPSDGRRKWLSLTPHVHEAMRNYVNGVVDTFSAGR
jgi:DNA-binding MarR family transcriptional regulator